MKQVDSVALGLVDKALGLAGTGSQVTDLEDGIVNQVLEISVLAARARSQLGPEGAKICILETVHGAANNQVAAVDPYFIGSTPGSIFNWPVPVPLGLDVWLHAISGLEVTGGSNFSSGYVGIVGDQAGDGGWGTNQAGAAVTAVPMRIPIIAWGDIGEFGNIQFMENILNGELSILPGIRIPRGMTVEFRTTSANVMTMQALLLMSLVPVGLAQSVSAS